MIARVNQPVNLGLTLQISWTGAASFIAIGNGLRVYKNAAKKAGYRVQGDWDAAILYFMTFPKRMDTSLERAHRQIAVMYAEDLRGAWNTQSLKAKWKPLNAQYLKKKIAKRLDRRTLIASQAALKSIGVRFLQALELEVGVTAVKDGEPYMMVQEFGSRDGRIPARPLAGPVFYSNLNRYLKVVTDAVNTVLNGKEYPDYAAGAIQ